MFDGPLGLLAVGLLVATNGFFVATEFAIVAVRRSRLAQLVTEGRAGARAAQDVVGHLDRYIAACQLGITMASLALGWIGESAFSGLVEPPLERLVGGVAREAAQGVAAAVSFGLITALHIVLGELAPKGLALQRTEATTLFVARPMQVFHAVFRWPVALLNGIGNGLLRLVGLAPAGGHEMVHSVEELRLLVTGMQQAGVVEATEARIASRAFQFGDLTAGALMTPRTEIAAVPVDAGVPALLAAARATTHTRLPVFEESLDNLVGWLRVRDLFDVLDQPAGGEATARGLMRPLLVTPQGRAADLLLEDMRASRCQLAVVVDEYGGTAGIITLEDLLEALVGRVDEDPPLRPAAVSATPAATLESQVLDGLTRLEEFEEVTGIRLDPAAHDAVETLGGLVMLRLGRVAQVGDEVPVDGTARLRVEALDGRRVAAVRLLRHEAARGQ